MKRMIITLIFGLIVANVFTSCSDKEELEELAAQTEETNTLHRYYKCYHKSYKELYNGDNCILAGDYDIYGNELPGTIYHWYSIMKDSLKGDELRNLKEMLAADLVEKITQVYRFNVNAECIHLPEIVNHANEIRYYVVHYINQNENPYDKNELKFIKQTLNIAY